jgi:hypothetical protein
MEAFIIITEYAISSSIQLYNQENFQTNSMYTVLTQTSSTIT